MSISTRSDSVRSSIIDSIVSYEDGLESLSTQGTTSSQEFADAGFTPSGATKKGVKPLIDGKVYTYRRVTFQKLENGRWDLIGAAPEGWPTHIMGGFNTIYQLRSVIDFCLNPLASIGGTPEAKVEEFPSIYVDSSPWGI